MILYEKQGHLGGHVKTVLVDGIDLDMGFMVFNGQWASSMLHSSMLHLCKSISSLIIISLFVFA
ncbi:putative amine oxidase [Helianthus annuus]|uniref:Amine oxidase n=1 Tax=Helianthus annuus TaxID=4232 RepID=A0A251T021_HELAN|nr:putative amine oxidase [Helianthus annuus]KAJ0724924.1 putative amine oxidase [Helianthus annuus]